MYAYGAENPIKHIDYSGKSIFTTAWLEELNILIDYSSDQLGKLEKFTVKYVTESQEWYYQGMVSEYSKGDKVNKINLFLYTLGWAWSDLWVNGS